MDLLVNVDVEDLEAATRFYGAAFGLTVGRRFGDAGVELLGSNAPIYLLARRAGSMPAPGADRRRHYSRHWTPVHLDFVVDDVEAAVARAQAAGAVLEQPVSTGAWGRLAVMADPFGHGFCFVPVLGRGYDEIAQA